MVTLPQVTGGAWSRAAHAVPEPGHAKYSFSMQYTKFSIPTSTRVGTAVLKFSVRIGYLGTIEQCTLLTIRLVRI